MISASAADAHRFGRVKRNGYDPAEVDAVVGRLVDALRSYERSTAQLEERLAEADVSADAIRRTFIAAEQTRDEIIEAAREQARRLASEAEIQAAEVIENARTRAAQATERSEREVAALADLADRLDLEIGHRRESLLQEAEDRASALLTDAEEEAARRTIMSVHQARAVAESAAAEIEDHRRHAGLMIRTMSMAAAWTRREAELAAATIVEDAEAEAALIVADAMRERGALSERIAELRAALTTLESGAAQVAALTAHHSGVLDLTTIERIEALNLDFAAVEFDAAEDVSAIDGDVDADRAAPREQTDEIVEASPDTPTATMLQTERTVREEQPAVASAGAGPVAEPPRLTVAHVSSRDDGLDVGEASDEVPEPTDDESADAPRTYYQRSTGIPLSERVKLARRSG